MKRLIALLCVFLASMFLMLALVQSHEGEASLLFASNSGTLYDEEINGESQDKITIILGKRLMNLDDVRLGDYSIREDEDIISVAHEELETALKMLLTLRGKEFGFLGSQRGSINNLKHLGRLYRSTFPRERKKVAPLNTLWDQEDQAFLDALVSQHINALQRLTASEEEKSLLFYLNAHHLIATKKEKEGEAILKTLSQQTPAGEYQMRAAGELTFRSFLKKEYRSVIESSNLILRAYPNTRASQDAHYFLGRAYHMSNAHDLAITHFDRLISHYRNNKWNEGAKYFRAKSHYFLRNFPLAVLQFENFIAEYPNSVYRDDAREMIARAYEQQQDFERALEAFEKYREDNKSVLDQIVADRKIYTYAKVLRILKKQAGDSTKAQQYEAIVSDYPNKLNGYISKYPSDNVVVAQTLFDLSQYYLNNNDFDKAIACLVKLKDRRYSTNRSPLKRGDPTDQNYGLIHTFLVDYNLARAYVLKGEKGKVDLYKEQFARNGALHYYYLIRFDEISILEKRGRFEEARAAYDQLYQDKNLPKQLKARALFQIGNCFFSLLRKEEARNTYQRIVDEYPNEPIARNARNMVSFLNSQSTHKPHSQTPKIK